MNTKGRNILQARKKAGLTLEELGEKVGVSKATIKRYETGEITNIPSDRIELIAKATGVSESFIMGWEELKEDNASFHAYMLKDKKLQDMVKKYYQLSDNDKELINNMIDSLLQKKD